MLFVFLSTCVLMDGLMQLRVSLADSKHKHELLSFGTSGLSCFYLNSMWSLANTNYDFFGGIKHLYRWHTLMDNLVVIRCSLISMCDKRNMFILFLKFHAIVKKSCVLSGLSDRAFLYLFIFILRFSFDLSSCFKMIIGMPNLTLINSSIPLLKFMS